jgi:hypothetical protein
MQDAVDFLITHRLVDLKERKNSPFVANKVLRCAENYFHSALQKYLKHPFIKKIKLLIEYPFEIGPII